MNMITEHLLLRARRSYRAQVAALQPLLWYRFDETSGALINHGSVGASMNATNNGALTGQTSLTGDGSYDFDGTDSAATPANWDAGARPILTSQLVFRPESWAGVVLSVFGVEASTSASDSLFRFQVISDGGTFSCGGRGVSVTTSVVFPVNQWHIATLVHDENEGDFGVLRLYINGALYQAKTGTIAPPLLLPPVSMFAGGNPALPGFFWSGQVDDFAMFPSKLSADEVFAMHAALGLTGGF